MLLFMFTAVVFCVIILATTVVVIACVTNDKPRTDHE